MNLNFMLGTAKIDITPHYPIPLAGFQSRQGNSEGISRPLYARVLYFLQQAEPGGRPRAAILVSADLIWWGTEQVETLREILRESCGLDKNCVIFHATHTHSGPQTTDRFAPSLALLEPEYIKLLESRLLDGVKAAVDALEPVIIETGQGECRIGIHRRKEVDGRIVMAPNEHGCLDPEVNIVKFSTTTGAVKAILTHYTCHPTTTADNLISSEFPGAAMEYIEESLGGDVLAVYLQGCCGDIRPNLTRDGMFYRGSEKEVQELGLVLAEEVLSVLNKPMRCLALRPLLGESVEVQLPFQTLPPVSSLEELKNGDDIFAEWSRLLLEQPERLRPTVPFEISVLHIADGLSIVAMNGEVVSEYGMFVKKICKGAGLVLPVAYSNGMVGYIPTARQVFEGGYEAKDSIYYFGLPAPFDPSLEEMICQSIAKLIGMEELPTKAEKPAER